MALERTFSILKPDATARNLTGAINAMIEQAGLRIVAQKRLRISLPQARKFYAVHRERPFFGELVDFMDRSCGAPNRSKSGLRTGPILPRETPPGISRASSLLQSMPLNYSIKLSKG